MLKHIVFKRVIISILMVLLIILITFVISSIWILNASYIETGILKEETSKYQYIADDFSMQITEAEIVLQKIENSNIFSQLLTNFHENNAVAEALYEDIDFDSFFENASEGFTYENLVIYTTNPSVLIEGKIEFINQSILSEEWFSRISASRRKSVLFFTEQDAYILYKMSVLDNVNDYSSYGVVSFDLSFLQYIALENFKMMLSNVSTNTIIGISGDRVLDLPTSDYFGMSESTYIADEMVLSYVVVAGSSATRWNLLIVKEKTNFIGEFISYALVVLSVILAIAFVIYYRYNFIRKVDKSFHELSQNKIQSIIEKSRPNRMDHIISNMYAKIETLVKENQALDMMNQQTEAQKNEAEIKAILSQINPHYIFNMLNSIHKRALKNNETESAKMIILMSKQLRRSLDWKEPFVTIKDELEHIKSYIELQQYYFGEEYNIEYVLDQRLYEVKVPKLMLQTLIENALKHGVQSSPFHIKLDEKDRHVRFCIKNEVLGNTKDVQDKVMHALNQELPSESGDGIGLPSMAKRLKYYYDGEFLVTTHINKQTISISVEFPKDVRR